MAKIMVVAGGNWQCPIIKTAKTMGHFVICSNLYDDSPAFKFADIGETADVLDKKKNLEIAKRHMPDAVLTDQSDIAVPTVAYIANSLGLNGISEKTAQLFTNKFKMREFCSKHDFPCPQYRLCENLSEAINFFSALKKKKAVIKPIDSQSSRGIYIIHSVSEIQLHFADTLRYSNAEQAILIEEYIEGKEFTVDGLKTANDYYVTAISKKNHFPYNPSIAQELLFSNYDDQYDYDALRSLNKQMVLSMGLEFGLTHAEYKYMDGQFYLIEIAARGGGTKISSDIVPVMSGYDSNRIFIHMLLGITEPINICYKKDICAVLGFFDFAPGKIKSVKGLETAKQLPGILDLDLNFHPGDTITQAKDDRSRTGYYIIRGDSYDMLRKIETSLKSAITIEYERQ